MSDCPHPNFDTNGVCTLCKEFYSVKHDTARVYRPERVTRSDAGGKLYAPVDQHGNESGDTPSYDREAIKRRCYQLNAMSAKAR